MESRHTGWFHLPISVTCNHDGFYTTTAVAKVDSRSRRNPHDSRLVNTLVQAGYVVIWQRIVRVARIDFCLYHWVLADVSLPIHKASLHKSHRNGRANSTEDGDRLYVHCLVHRSLLTDFPGLSPR